MESRPASHRSGLTLLELLGVVLVFFIIWSFVFPASESMIRNGRRRQAAADVRTLASAVLAYRQEYGHFPDQGDNWDEDIVYRTEGVSSSASGNIREVDAERLLQCLSATNEVDNPRRILFFEDSPERVVDDIFEDPWGDPYVVVADGNADGWIGSGQGNGNTISSFQMSDSTASLTRTHTVPGIRESVYVFSWGGSHTNAISNLEGSR